MKVKKLFKKGLPLVLSAMCVGLISCGGGGGETTSIDYNQKLDDDDPILETDTIENDVTKGSDGLVEFEEEVELKMWSIIGSPDNVKFHNIVSRFNDEYSGEIHIEVVEQGHFDYYSALENVWSMDFASAPDICLMHNEKTTQYASRGYLYPITDKLWSDAGVEPLNFDNVYSNIDRVTVYRGSRFAVPIDAHGFLTHIRQDIIKKNNLGFDNNTRFVPASRAEYQQLLEGLREKADAGTLLIRDINRGADHSWKTASSSSFYPSYHQSTDPDGLGALYANGGNLVSDDQKTITYQNNEGFLTYVTDQVERANARLVGEDSTNTSMFGAGTTVMFTEGPWQTSGLYESSWNNSELRTEGKGVSAEDAADLIMSYPLAAAHPNSWWTLEENMNTELGSKWYGNGHAFSITRHCTSMKKVAAALTFMKYYIEGTYETKDGEAYNLTEWCSAGHVPAWKNVYESEDYKALLKTNKTLAALGNPKDIIAMETVVYEATIFQSLADAVAAVQTAYKNGPVTKEKAIEIVKDAAAASQVTLDIMLGI